MTASRSPQPVAVRRAALGDSPAIAVVFDAAVRVGWTYLGPMVREPLFTDDDWVRLVVDHAAPNVLLVAAPHDGRGVFGFVAARPDSGELFLLFVHPDHAGSGVGRRLLGAAHAALRAAGREKAFLHVHADNARAISAYQRAGYTHDGTHREGDFRGTTSPSSDSSSTSRSGSARGAISQIGAGRSFGEQVACLNRGTTPAEWGIPHEMGCGGHPRGGTLERLAARVSPAAGRQRAGLDERDHRPWPVPGPGWIMGQTWEALLFAHWRVPVAEVRRRVPRALSVDVIDGSGWVAITPFVLRGLRLRGTPPVRGTSTFPELNVRTYVTVDGKPGIYFFSLDAGSRLAVAGARLTYGLPYHRADMRVAARGSAVEYSSRRIVGRGARPAVLSGRYEPVGEAATPAPGTLEHHLTERYCLYAIDRAGRVRRGEIHHPPWRLQPARLDIRQNSMGEPIGLDLPGRPVLQHFSGRQDVVVWPPARVPAERAGD